MPRDPPESTTSCNNGKRKRSSHTPPSDTCQHLQTLLQQEQHHQQQANMPGDVSDTNNIAILPQKTKTKTLECLSLGNNKLKIMFSVAGAEDICAISQMEIVGTEVDFVTNNPPLFPKDPEINKAVIAECGHCFHALSLVYHFLRNCMACPMCRHGDRMYPLAVRSFPKNKTVSQLHVIVQSLQRKERADEIRAETEDIRNELYMDGGTGFIINSIYDLTTLTPTLSMYTYNPYTIALSTPVLQNACMLMLDSINTSAVPSPRTPPPPPPLPLNTPSSNSVSRTQPPTLIPPPPPPPPLDTPSSHSILRAPPPPSPQSTPPPPPPPVIPSPQNIRNLLIIMEAPNQTSQQGNTTTMIFTTQFFGPSTTDRDNVLCYSTTAPNARQLSLGMCPRTPLSLVIFNVTVTNPYTHQPLLLASSPPIDLRLISPLGFTLQAHRGHGSFTISVFDAITNGEPPTIRSVIFTIELHALWTLSINQIFALHADTTSRHINPAFPPIYPTR